MTQLTNWNANMPSAHFYSFSSQPPQENQNRSHYLVQEPLGKRPFPPEFELDMEYAPRAKRRFDKISSCLENFSISNDSPQPSGILDSSSEDDEMDDVSAIPPMDEENLPSSSSSDPVISEPDDEPGNAKKIRIDDSLKQYLQQLKSDHYSILPKPEKLKGNELAVWQPTILISPKNDFNMSGRITEIDEKEEEKVNQERKNRYIEMDGMLDEEDLLAAGSTNNCGIVELDNSDDSLSANSDTGSSWNSPTSSQVVEIDDETRNVITPNSLTNGSVSDEDMMDFDD